MAIGTTPVANERFGNVSSGTLATTPTNGNSLLFVREAFAGATSLTSITETNVAWARPSGAGLPYAVNRHLDFWIGAVSASPAAAWSVSTAFQTGFFVEWAGLSGGIDTGASGGNHDDTGTNAIASTISVTPAAGTEVLLLAFVGRGNTFSSGPSNGFTDISSTSNNTRVAYKYIASASGSYSTDWTFTAGQVWDTYIVTLTAAGGGGGGRTLALPPGLDGHSCAGVKQFNPVL